MPFFRNFKKYMKLTDIADLAGFKAGSVSRYRKVLGLAGKRESDKAEYTASSYNLEEEIILSCDIVKKISFSCHS